MSSSFTFGHNIRINPIFRERHFSFDQKLVFVLMPFSEPWSERVWEKISQVILSKFLRPQRADNRYGAIVTEDIWKGIVEAKLIICDTTGWNPNVFYELGIAHTLGKNVILLSQPTSHLPFDTQGFRHLFYTDEPEGMKKIETELSQWIDYCLSSNTGIVKPDLSPEEANADKILERRRERMVSKEARRLAKIRIRQAWVQNSRNYDPPLPPIEFQVQRNRLGVLRTKMAHYTYGLSDEAVQAFVEDLQRVWPESWEGLSTEEVNTRCTEIEQVVNSRH